MVDSSLTSLICIQQGCGWEQSTANSTVLKYCSHLGRWCKIARFWHKLFYSIDNRKGYKSGVRYSLPVRRFRQMIPSRAWEWSRRPPQVQRQLDIRVLDNKVTCLASVVCSDVKWVSASEMLHATDQHTKLDNTERHSTTIQMACSLPRWAYHGGCSATRRNLTDNQMTHDETAWPSSVSPSGHGGAARGGTIWRSTIWRCWWCTTRRSCTRGLKWHGLHPLGEAV